ncbi:hypothetical protein NDU88_002442 [Pleurodeles waltl]|uniref:Uncharacterized protein n=1 Tax=Pleurodeles waltl TaxID=8319 RepID=A0AAV7T289_PLEWA|nr:hypothetical protein NDU88_002442 [Pleurodeles waltl]
MGDLRHWCRPAGVTGGGESIEDPEERLRRWGSPSFLLPPLPDRWENPAGFPEKRGRGPEMTLTQDGGQSGRPAERNLMIKPALDAVADWRYWGHGERRMAMMM